MKGVFACGTHGLIRRGIIIDIVLFCPLACIPQATRRCEPGGAGDFTLDLTSALSWQSGPVISVSLACSSAPMRACRVHVGAFILWQVVRSVRGVDIPTARLVARFRGGWGRLGIRLLKFVANWLWGLSVLLLVRVIAGWLGVGNNSLHSNNGQHLLQLKSAH